MASPTSIVVFLFCFLSLSSSSKGHKFSQKFNPDAKFVVISGYSTDNCGGPAEMQIIQQMENCEVGSFSSMYYTEKKGKLYIHDCDDTVCGNCVKESVPVPTKQCSSESDGRPLILRNSRDDDGSFGVISNKIEVFNGFPKELAKNKEIMVGYTSHTQCNGDITLMWFFTIDECLGYVCRDGYEFTCDVDALLKKLAPGWAPGLSGGVIAAIVIIVIAVTAVIIGALLYIRHKRGDRGRSYFDRVEKDEQNNQKLEEK